MATTTAAFSGLLRKNVQGIVQLWQDANPSVGASIIGKTISDMSDQYLLRGVVATGALQVTPEDSGVIYESPYTAQSLTVTPKMYTLGITLTKQLKAQDVNKILSRPGDMLAHSLWNTKETAIANMLTLGFTAPSSNGTPTLDNVALFSASHPLETGTSSNFSATTLSASNLESAMAAMGRQKDHKGFPMVYSGTTMLVVPNELEFEAKRIVNSVLQAGTPNNDKNIVGQGLQVLVNPFLTDTNAWFLLNKQVNPLCWLNRIPQFVESDYDMDMQRYKVVVGQEWATFAEDWRGVHGANT